MDLALNNIQSLVCHKTQPTNNKNWANQTEKNVLKIIPYFASALSNSTI